MIREWVGTGYEHDQTTKSVVDLELNGHYTIDQYILRPVPTCSHLFPEQVCRPVPLFPTLREGTGTGALGTYSVKDLGNRSGDLEA